MEKALQEVLSKLLETSDTKLTVPEAINYNNQQEVDNYFKTLSGFIHLSPQELFKGMSLAYTTAGIRLIQELESEKRVHRRESHMRMWTAQEMGEKALFYGKLIGSKEGFDFKLDKHNENVFNLLCLYFTNDKRFEDAGYDGRNYSLNKGIWLQSDNRGTGKSVLLRSFSINKRSCFGYKNTMELAMMFQKNGFDGIDDYINVVSQPPSPLNFYQSEAGFMYDELFGEDKVMHMGSPLSLSSYIINKLYDFSTSDKSKKWKFHCTSNAAGPDIEKIAGKTYRSRMPDMFNLIKLDGPDRR